MPLTTYPVGAQILKVPVTIVIPAVNTPFNPDAINPAITWTWNGMKALEAYGLFGGDFYKAQPPYPTSGGPYVNSQTYYLSGGMIFAGATGISFSSDRSYTRTVTAPPTRSPDSWWAYGEEELSTPRPAYKQKYSPLSPSAPWLMWLVQIPSTGTTTLTSVSVRIDPADGLHGALPDDQPILTIWKYTASTGLMTAITTVQDAQPDVASFEMPHDLELTGLSYSSWTAEDALVIGVRGEEGNNGVAAATYADAGLVVYHPIITFTRTRLGEE